MNECVGVALQAHRLLPRSGFPCHPSVTRLLSWLCLSLSPDLSKGRYADISWNTSLQSSGPSGSTAAFPVWSTTHARIAVCATLATPSSALVYKAACAAQARTHNHLSQLPSPLFSPSICQRAGGLAASPSLWCAVPNKAQRPRSPSYNKDNHGCRLVRHGHERGGPSNSQQCSKPRAPCFRAERVEQQSRISCDCRSKHLNPRRPDGYFLHTKCSRVLVLPAIRAPPGRSSSSSTHMHCCSIRPHARSSPKCTFPPFQIA